jgi:hypothetical protein
MDSAGFDDFLAEPACGFCAGRSRLASTGVLLREVLESVRPYPLEGSGLGGFLNPLLLDDRRSWAEFVAGTFFVFAERSPSTDSFDFVVQHVAPWPRFLEAVRARGLSTDRPLADLWSYFSAADQKRYADADLLVRLEVAWETSRRGEAALAAAGPIRSNEDAWAVADAMTSPQYQATAATTESMLARIAALANAAA